jgi:hypothetical protein
MTPKELVQRWVDAFNRADVATLAAMYASDATNHQVADSLVVGRDAIRDFFAAGFAAAEMHCIVENLFQDGEWAILEWRDPKGLRGCSFSTSSATTRSSSSAATGTSSRSSNCTAERSNRLA